MQHRNIYHTNTANRYKRTVQSSKNKAVRLTKAGKMSVNHGQHIYIFK